MKVKFTKFTSVSGAAMAAVLSFAGCSSTVNLPVDSTGTYLSEEETLNRASVRDDSALLQSSSRGGAAFRQAEDSTQVLFNKHHMAGMEENIKDRINSKYDGKASLNVPPANTYKTKKAEPAINKNTESNKKNDRSIYSKKAKKTDKSIYLKKADAKELKKKVVAD